MLPLVPIALQLAQLAPVLMRHFGVGEDKADAAQAVVDLAQQVSGAQSPEDALAALKANSALQVQFNERAMELDAQLEAKYLDDRADARGRDVAYITTGHRNVRADVMVGLAFIAVIAIAALLALGKIDGNTAAGGFLIAVGGMFARNIGTAFDFEFGSSRSSQNKDTTINQLMQK